MRPMIRHVSDCSRNVRRASYRATDKSPARGRGQLGWPGAQKARATLIAAVLTAGAAAPVAQGATPLDIHAHRGGTVVNGKPTFSEESLDAYRHAAPTASCSRSTPS